MLTSELLVTRIRKGKIEPVYASLDPESLEVAESVIAAFQGHVGKTYGELNEELESLEEINYRLIRGLSQILERRCIIDRDSVIDPIIARNAVFEECGGFVADETERKETLKRIAEKLSIKPDELERALWADHEENLIVKEFQAITPEDLLKQYNLSLAQTLLFKSTGMEIQMEGNYQPLFWKIKQLGLMYSILDDKIYLDGPISLFKLTERYGTSFAKLLPTIIKAPKWSLKASVIKKSPQGKKLLEFNLDHSSRYIFGMDHHVVEKFDSAIEKEFFNLSFNGWIVRREPTVLRAGKYAFIPDFSLERNGIRIYIEIVGFWTAEYLKNKIQKINQLKEKESLILLVNKSLGCSGSEFNANSVIFYDRKIPQIEILKILRKYEEKQHAEEMTELGNIKISFDSNKSVINLAEIAERYNVSLEAIRDVIKSQNIQDYSLVGDQLVSVRLLGSIQSELAGVKRHCDALKLFESYNIKAKSQALTFLGYKVKWSGLDPESAEIFRA